MSELLDNLIQDARLWKGKQRTRVNLLAEPTGYPRLDDQLGNTGWPIGALSECLLEHPGIGELQLLLPLMKQIADSRRMVFWINPPCIPYAPALARSGISLDQVVIIHTRSTKDTVWTLENCLRAAVTGLVMAWPERLAAREIRRLQLAASAGHTVCVLFRHRHHAHNSSPAALRLELNADPQLGLQVTVLKRRGGWPGQSCQLPMAERIGQPESRPSQVVTGPWAGSGG